ncbi:Predicted coiled-coil protein [Ceraceosorus bombacis]|uniref:Predicted coiled-coil protein n=1 Tax=Ceraceosorus bombacis TaxID=401625 RepID=A0A0P1BBX1_9BASI|nr:Predicted coiled-coil protein [Ceraceosorus bombacis]
MATAKIATLLIRTIAKPIATQLKSQAAQHDTFKKICVNLAQGMHRSEMALRSNLMGGTAAHTKVRPLNEKKAIENGATAISEGFLFAIAAALIIGESYRSSSSNRKQRDRTETAVEEIRDAIEMLGSRLGVEKESLWRNGRPLEDVEVDAAEEAPSTSSSLVQPQIDEATPNASTTTGSVKAPATLFASAAHISELESDRERLQHAVAVLLRLALKSGWIEGPEALRLDRILQKGNSAHVAGSAQRTSKDATSEDPTPSSQRPSLASLDLHSSTSAAATSASGAHLAAPEETSRSDIISEVAKARAAEIAREVRYGASDGNSSSLAELLEKAGLSETTASETKQ